MCQDFETVKFVGKDTTVAIFTVPCDKKPLNGTPEQCPKYRYTALGLSYRKEGPLPLWSDNINNGTSGFIVTHSS